jgi:regulator of cell morphogenesis and NO signaling
MTQPTVREIAAANPAAVRVFEKYGIDYCCGGGRVLEDACRERGVSPTTVMAEVEQSGRAGSAGRDWSQESLTSLIGHIVMAHHAYLNSEMPLLAARMAKVLEKHGPKDPQKLGALSSTLSGLKDELLAHLRKEEMVLFPAIEQMEAAIAAGHTPAPSPFGTVQNPIRMMEFEHDGAGRALETMRSLTGGYVPPQDACPTFIALYEGLAALEKDTHLHIHLENNILFPRAVELESRVR